MLGRSALLWGCSLTWALSPVWADPPAAVKKVETPSIRSVPVQAIAGPAQEQVRTVLDKVTLSVRGPTETFACQLDQYRWLLDHPDRAVVAWRRLGAKCVNIDPRAEGAFSWTDDQGSEVIWRTVLRGPDVRVWLAEGKVKPGLLLPLVPVKAVVVLKYAQVRDEEGTLLMQHQSDLFLQTDSKSASLVAKMLGASAQRMAEQGLGQLQIFFSGLAWHMDRHPDQIDKLFLPTN